MCKEILQIEVIYDYLRFWTQHWIWLLFISIQSYCKSNNIAQSRKLFSWYFVKY